VEPHATLDPTDGPLTFEELQLATRNRGLPLEAMRYDITPTGLHYLLVHFDIPEVDPGAWRLRVGGLVRRPLELSLAELRARPRETIAVTLECAGNGRAHMSPRSLSQPWLVEAIGTAEWTGTALAGVLQEAGLRDEAMELVFSGSDRGVQGDIEHDYARSLTIADASRPEVLLAYEMNGQPLEPQHGFPVRLIVPGWYGMTSVKWLATIEAIDRQFDGYQQTPAYHYQMSEEELGEPVRRMRPRALVIPPGIPDFFTRRRILDAGPVKLRGRAWSGEAPIAGVEVGIDGQWRPARLEPAIGPYAWRSWSADWQAAAGPHVLSCRAVDAAGNEQPTVVPWNYQGMGNNLVQRVDVEVR